MEITQTAMPAQLAPEDEAFYAALDPEGRTAATYPNGSPLREFLESLQPIEIND
jgi:hypothetical protein